MPTMFIQRVHCPLCQSSGVKELIRRTTHDRDFVNYIRFEPTFKDNFFKDFNEGLMDDQIFSVLKCQGCGFIFQQYILNDQGMVRLYMDWMDQHMVEEVYGHSNAELVVRYQLEEHRFVKAHFGGQRLNVLDWGAGLGIFCKIIKSHFNDEVYAYEFTDEKNHYLAEHGIISKCEREIPENYFHFININQVLEHVADPVGMIRKVLRYSREDGIMYLSTPNCTTIERKLRAGQLDAEAHDQLSPYQHINSFTNATLKTAGRLAGLKSLFQPFLKMRTLEYHRPVDYVKNLVRPIKSYMSRTDLYFQKS